MNAQSSYDSIEKLVETYHDVAAGGRAMEFDETSTRITLLNPFWEALGWNVADPREVVHEKRVHTRQGIKRADYCFNVRGKAAFVLEAKQPGVSLRDPDVVFQAKRYGYNLPVNFAVISDFEEFRLFDSGLEPLYNNPARGLIKQFDLTFEQYLDNWDNLYATFSREAVYDGTLDALLPKARRTRNKEALDRKFFERLTKWREEFARVIALDNGDLSVYEINEAVQRILDRIIFIRVIEDREIEPIEHLQDALSRWGREKEKPLYRYVVDVFRRMDPQYNGQLFSIHFSEDLLLRDKPLADFIKSLYYPDCPYQFNAIGVEMLGTIYERFLGSTITLTPAHRAKVEQKPEVRKAGGVYYTPAYIVDYIVENTVGELLSKCKKPNDALKLKILDPACGSGSFLLGAFGRLIDWFEDYYNEHPEKMFKGSKTECWYDEGHPDGPRWRLTARYKGGILKKCIYGVDIDPQAVEVTIMSLYLRVLESVNVGLLLKTALLPPLEGNVKCGNSLIGSDYWEFVRESQGELFERGEAEERRVNTFDWDVEFPDIVRYAPGSRDLAEGFGFDAVIGNPPWGAALSKEDRVYLEKYFDLHNTDTACLFMAKSVELLNGKGLHGFIIPKPFVYASNWRYVRERFIGNIKEVVDCGKVWQKVKLEQIIYFMERGEAGKEYISKIREEEIFTNLGNVDKVLFDDFGLILNGVTPDDIKIGERIKGTGAFLNDYIENQRGSFLQKKVISEISDYKVLGGKEINRYGLKEKPKGYIKKADIIDPKAYIEEGSIIAQNIIAHIMNPIPHVRIIATVLQEEERDKSIILDTVNEFKNSSDVSIFLLLGILNSKLVSWYVYKFIFGNAIRTMHFDNPITSRIPYPDFENHNEVQRKLCGKIEKNVKELFDLNKRDQAVRSDNDKRIIRRQIERLEGEIDKIVEELYGVELNK